MFEPGTAAFGSAGRCVALARTDFGRRHFEREYRIALACTDGVSHIRRNVAFPRSPMKTGTVFFLLALLALPVQAGGVYDLEIVPVKPGIYLLRRPDPLRQPVECNATVIVNAQDVVVVDGGGAPLAASNAIRLIRSVTDKPVSTLITTHWHGDHNFGNQVYRATFPAIRIISHENTYRNMTGEAMTYVKTYPKQIADYQHELEAQAAKKPLSAGAATLLEDLKVVHAQLESIQVTPADLTFEDRLILHRATRDIEVRYFGKANTDGDAAVWLPQDKVLVSGDIVVNPIPYGIGSFPREWIAALQAVGALPFDTLIPGHGEVLHDRAYLDQLIGTLTAIRAQVAGSVAKGLDLEATRKALDTSSFASAYTLDDPLRKQLFDAWWVRPIARSAWLEARGEPIVQSGTGANN
jgi:glyoxylase-like metal-dependent hydrolase (beta-lactamase superfamily II)